jgi:exodeoxyribonuclease-3
VKILSININSIRAHLDSFMEIMALSAYDTVLVQELKVEDHAFPYILFDHLGYNIKVFGQKSWNGVAVFSKLSIEDVSRGIPGYADPAARLIECVIGGSLRLINVYMPNGESVDSPKFPYKIEWMTSFARHISPYLTSEERVVIGGDFNVAIADRDIWNPRAYEGSSISAPAARAVMQKWLDAGWGDCYRTFHPDAADAWTWVGYRGGSLEKNNGLRLDYFLANPAALKHVKKCWIDRGPRLAEKPTDHLGLALEI